MPFKLSNGRFTGALIPLNGLRGRIGSGGMTREGLTGTYLFELEAHPGWPQGRSVTTAGSKPINGIERPRRGRPWSRSFLSWPIVRQRYGGRVALCPDRSSESKSSANSNPKHKCNVDEAHHARYHCINRCVRRAFLCGDDPVTGKNFDHRKDWIQGRLEFLAGRMGIDVLGFAVLSNHIHVVLRTRPDVVKEWSDEEVARRWWNLFPLRRNKDESPAGPEERELGMITLDKKRLKEIRRRLSSISWLMRCLAEPIARISNEEDGAPGRFWAGRFKSVPILDENALAACLAYVDLNPVRARIAETPESSRYTSVFERIEGSVGEGGIRSVQQAARVEPDDETERYKAQVLSQAAMGSVKLIAPESSKDKSKKRESSETVKLADRVRPANLKRAERGAWLSPLELAKSRESKKVPSGRASNKGCLAMTFAEYLQLLDWTGREIRADKRGALPDGIAPILERLSVTREGWLRLVTEFSRLFRRSAGTPTSLTNDAEHRGQKRRAGITNSRAVFVLRT